MLTTARRTMLEWYGATHEGRHRRHARERFCGDSRDRGVARMELRRCPLSSPPAGVDRSFAACIASAVEVPVAEFPLHPLELSSAIGRWRSWLAGRGLGLVALASPDNFKWPGYWIAVLGEQDRRWYDGPEGQAAVLMFGTPSGVVLSPQAAGLLGRAAADLPVQQGYVLAI